MIFGYPNRPTEHLSTTEWRHERQLFYLFNHTGSICGWRRNYHLLCFILFICLSIC